MRIGIFVLCYNVEKQISSVLRSLHRGPANRASEIVVINNQSTDRTLNTAKQTVQDLKMPHVTILHNHSNYGYGGSHKVAFNYFASKNFDYALLVHGDGQGDSQALYDIISECEKNESDFVIGSRFMNPKLVNSQYSPLRKWANLFFVTLQQLVTGIPITDPGSGEIAYRLSFVKTLPYLKFTDSFHFTPELLLVACRKGFRFKEIPVRWGKVETSSVNIWRHGFEMMRILMAHRIRPKDYVKPSQTASRTYESDIVFSSP